MKNTLLTASITVVLFCFGLSQATAGVIGSDQVIASQQQQFNQQQVMSFIDSAEVQTKLLQLGVSPDDAKQRIANMTNEELTAFNNQLNEMPAGGVVGTIITVLVVVAVLDLMGITNVYPFIRPIGS
ncbi:PA2779 family protein [Alishewanella longhuensis]